MIKKSLFLQILLSATLQNNIIFCEETKNQLPVNAMLQIEKLEQKLEQKENDREWNIAYATICATLTTIGIINHKEISLISIFTALTALNVYFAKKRMEDIFHLSKELELLKNDSTSPTVN